MSKLTEIYNDNYCSPGIKLGLTILLQFQSKLSLQQMYALINAPNFACFVGLRFTIVPSITLCMQTVIGHRQL